MSAGLFWRISMESTLVGNTTIKCIVFVYPPSQLGDGLRIRKPLGYEIIPLLLLIAKQYLKQNDPSFIRP